MKSVHIASAAIAATASTIASVAVLSGAPEALVGQAYDRALTAANRDGGATPGKTVHGQNSEHFWLTNGDGGLRSDLTPVVTVRGTPVPLADLKRAIAKVGDFDAMALDVVDVQPIARATIGAATPMGRSLLVTVRVPVTTRQPARLIKFVVDVGASPVVPARAL